MHINLICVFLKIVFLGFLKVGMTHSYGNGRNPDENKALNDFNFQVK